MRNTFNPVKVQMNALYGRVGTKPPNQIKPQDKPAEFTPYLKCLRVIEPPVEVQRCAAKIVSATVEAGVYSIIAWFSEPTIRSLSADRLMKPFSFTHV